MFNRQLSTRLLFVTLLVAVAGRIQADEVPLFESEILPILNSRCGKCHSDQVQKGELNLSTIAGIRKGGESGESAVDESIDSSLMWIMIDGDDMPPEDQPRLSRKERRLIELWIRGGAPSESHESETSQPLNQHDVLPITLLRCTTCHGPRLKEGGLDLRTVASMKHGGDSGPALIPGDADASRMIQRIESQACPPREKLLKFFVVRPPDSEVDTLKKWIDAGAPEADIKPDVATETPDPLVTDLERQHWAFQPLKPASPETSIDSLIEARLAEHDLKLSPEADRHTLIRRAFLDLTGLPPSLDESNRWHSDESSDWYEQMVEELLRSPHYGERWGRYWLDLAGYADSEGGVSSDPLRKVAWKYRDYVIDSFNQDTPYDEFLIKQLAGDELIDAESARVITPEMVRNLTATGFLRMGIDQTGSRTMNFVPERLGVINDAITVVGSGLMGLTMECARCHSHKYDPIPQRDYYRFKAIFQGALDEHDWLTFKNRVLTIDTSTAVTRYKTQGPQIQKRLRQLETQLKNSVRNVQLEMLRQHYPQQSEADREETLRALKIADNNRTLPQRLLVEKLQVAEAINDADQPPSVQSAIQVVRELEVTIRETSRQLPAPPTIRALWDRGEPSPTYILTRGEHNRSGRLVGPGVPSVLTDGRTPFEYSPPFPDGTAKSGRRLAFAKWLTHRDHPLTARVMVNRVWYHHFGTGLVKTLENFGVKGERPSHPKLLDTLASRFIDEGWSLKQLHRSIMTSRTYRQSSQITEDRLSRDPEHRLLSRMPIRRMDAETLRDSLLSVSGQLSDSRGGAPDPVTVDRNGLVTVAPLPGGLWRRSVYAQLRRTEIPTMLATFDYPEMGPNCLSRTTSTVSPQSLMMMNNQQIHSLAKAMAERVWNLSDSKPESAVDSSKLIDMVFKLAFSRAPAEEEKTISLQSFRELTAASNGDSLKALSVFCHTILNSAAFVYVD